MRLISRSPLAYPAGSSARFDPCHPMAFGTELSAVAVGNNFINYAPDLTPLGVVTGTPSSLLDGSLGLIKDTSTTWTTAFNSSKTASVDATLAAIIRTKSSPDNSGVFGNCTGSGFVGATLSLFSASILTFSSSNFGGDSSSAIALDDNSPYFIAASYSGASSKVNFVALNLKSGSVKTAITSTGAGSVPTSTGWTIGKEFMYGTNSGSKIAAVMGSSVHRSLSELLVWAKDPWAFWYPSKVSLPSRRRYFDFAPPSTFSAGGSTDYRPRKLRRIGLAYPAGSKFGFEPRSAGQPVFSAVSIGETMVDLTTGKFATISGGARSALIDGRLGPTWNVNGVPTTVSFSPNTSSKVTVAAIFIRKSGYAMAVMALPYQSSYGFYADGSGNLTYVSPALEAAAPGSIVLAADTPYFVAASFVAGVGSKFVARNLAMGVLQTGVTATDPGSPSGNTSYDVGNDAFGSSAAGNASYAAAAVTTRALSLAELIAWSADPWSYWYPPALQDVGYTAGSGAPSFSSWWANNNLPVLGTGTY